MALERQHIHLWVCEEHKGVMGEVTEERVLRVDEIQQIAENPESAKEICPHGVIKCKYCHAQIPEVDPRTKSNLTDMRTLLRPYVPSLGTSYPDTSKKPPVQK